MNKRGIGPLLATILLIVLAVAVGVVVMNFGRAQIESSAKCAVDIGLTIVELNQEEQLCYEKLNNQIYFIAENGPNVPLTGLRLRVIGSEAIFVRDLEGSDVEKAGTTMQYVDYDYTTYGDIKQFKLTPKVRLYDEEIICSEQSIEMENVRECKK
ncbi:hypothetical protein ACFLZB_00345 [Nanoarchaeota archaeon]